MHIHKSQLPALTLIDVIISCLRLPAPEERSAEQWDGAGAGGRAGPSGQCGAGQEAAHRTQERCWGNGVQQHTCVVEIPSLTSWVFVAQSPDGLQHTQPCAVLYYKPVNNSVLMVC